MFQYFKSWLVVTGMCSVALGLLAALGLGSYLIARVIYYGISLMQIAFK